MPYLRLLLPAPALPQSLCAAPIQGVSPRRDHRHLQGLPRRAQKRAFDIAASLILLIATLPVMLAAALAIRIEGPGPVFYRQERVGRGGRPFAMWKFRTMRVDAEAQSGPLWAAHGDPRVTRVGRFLRRARIDELPQLWNVLCGAMSLVGPRPERPFFVAELARAIPSYDERHRVKPGITGWAQVNYPYGASVDDARAKLTFDLFYVRNFSLPFDIAIMAATVRTVLSGAGAR